MTTDSTPPVPRPVSDALLACAPFARTPPEILESLARIAVAMQFESGQLVFSEGEQGRDVLVLRSGQMEARRSTPFGPQRVAVLAAGAVVGEISLLDGGPRSSSVAALEPGEAIRFPFAALAAARRAEPALELALLRIFCGTLVDKIRQANDTMTRIMAPDATTETTPPADNGASAPVDEETTRRLLAEQQELVDKLADLAHLVQGERYEGGQRIFSEGDPGDRLYVVADGEVRISRQIPGLGEEALTVLEAGEVFGEMAWVDTRPRSADAIAHGSGCTLFGISRDDLDAALSADSAIGIHFLTLLCQVLCQRIRRMNEHLVAYRTIAWF